VNILSFDGSNNNLSITIQKNNQFLINKTLLNKNNQSEKLISLIDENLGEINIEYKDLDFIAIANGPANFTGIRIQFTIAKIINLVAKVPVITVGTLEAFAYQYRNNAQKIVVIIDAKLDEFFIQEFEVMNKNLVAKYSPKILKKTKILEILPQDDFFLAGNSGIIVPNAKYAQPSNTVESKNIICLAKEKYSKNKFFFEDLSYMREPIISQRK
jgi:tRNA threonylcarbamoyladenosine biosynthesis protein TsaB